MSLTHLFLRLLLGRRLPTTSGEIRIRGPVDPVTIRRDERGVPHINAESEPDATFALGFCQGQDRAAQLELLWRVGRGRFAEWVGIAGLATDRMSRRIGFRRAAEKQLPALEEAIRAQLVSFAAGVSAGNTIGLPKKPHEFAILGGEPSAWDAADVLTLLKLQSFALASNWDVELARLRILLADGASAMLALDPTTAVRARSVSDAAYLGSHPVAHAPGSDGIGELAADLAALQTHLPATGGGSNNWVIAGSRTASGKPLLASDPHLNPTAPPPWYLAHVRCPEWEAAGAGLVGAPGFPIGHNGFVAWGVTAGLTDNTDFFIETLGRDGRSTKEADGTFSPCEVIRETIRVKDAPDVIEDVAVTPRGPLLSPLTPDIPLALSLRAVWLDPLPVNGFLGAVRAKSAAEFRGYFDRWPVLPLNVVYADTEGAIGWQLIGQLPRRKGGHGLLPRLASLPNSGWSGLVPFDEMPHVENATEGYFATANNPPPVTGGPFLGADYCDPYRVRVINEAIAARKEPWAVADCLALQQDVRSIPWEEMRDIVLSLTPTDVAAREALELLRGWDGRADSESPPACVFELFVAAMCARVARAKAPNSWLAAVGEVALGPDSQNLFAHRRVAHLIRLLREQPPKWFASWPAEMEQVLGDVVRKLRREVGPGSAFWAWGHLRQLRLEHPLFKNHRWLGPVFNLGPIPCGGDSATVSQASVRPAAPTAFTHNIANLRTVFDLADLSKSRFVLCGGQSGNPWSPHYADQLPLWREGESIVLPWLQAEVIRAARDTLRLLPAPG